MHLLAATLLGATVRRPPIMRAASATSWASDILAPQLPDVKVTTSPDLPSFSEYDAAILLVPPALATTNEAILESQWDDDKLFEHSGVCAQRIRQRLRRADGDEAQAGLFLTTELPNPRGTRACLLATGKDGESHFERLVSAGDAIAAAYADGARSICIASVGADDTGAMADALIAAAHAAAAPSPKASGTPAPAPEPVTLAFHGPWTLAPRTEAAASGANICRWLTQLPPNVLTPRTMRGALAQIGEANGFEVDVLDRALLEEAGCGAILAVAAGSGDDSGVCIVRLRRPAARPPADGASLAPLVLAGKCVTMDTGGVNVKGAVGMKGMKGDMAGAGAALGAAVALARLADAGAAPEHVSARPLECWLAVTDNLISADAYKPDDVVEACDKTTIEIVHTDAEGRMALADLLALASRKARWPGATADEPPPALVVDLATLTGTMITALSKRYAGVFASGMGAPEHEQLRAIIEAGAESGERLWPFPLDADFAKPLKSDVADTLQCTVASEADHIFAAKFLQRFVAKDVPWLHIDIAGPAKTDSLGHVRAKHEATGFGVRAVVWAILDQWDTLVGPER